MRKRKAEKPINRDISVERERLLETMRDKAGPDPYKSEAHDEAVKYIREREIKLRAL